MNQQSQITIVGRVGTRPALTVSATGTAWSQFRVASTVRRRRPDGEWADGDTTWTTVKVFRDLADNVCHSLTVGDEVLVLGQLTLEEYDKDGEKRMSATVKAEHVGVSLSRQRAMVVRVVREPAPENAGSDSAPDDLSSLAGESGLLAPVPAGSEDGAPF